MAVVCDALYDNMAGVGGWGCMGVPGDVGVVGWRVVYIIVSDGCGGVTSCGGVEWTGCAGVGDGR